MDAERRQHEIDAIMAFVERHRQSYASLAVCRRALDPGIEQITPPVLSRLYQHLQTAPDEEIAAYYDIVM